MVRDRFTDAYNKHDLQQLNASGREMMEIIHDMDALLATNSSFLLGKWIGDARSMGVNTREKDYFENNARTILTTWGQQGSDLTDYANRNLSGLMNDYYGKRWQMFIADVIAAAQSNQVFNQKEFDAKSEAFEWGWTKKLNVFPTYPVGNSLQISKNLYTKYASRIVSN